MAASKYAQNVGGAQRRSPLTRQEYQLRASELAVRGQDLPQSKLLDLDVISIRSAARQRESLKKHIRDNLSNEALAKRHGVHVRTIEKALARETHCALP